MKLKAMFDMQATLDSHINEKHQLEKENLIERKILALLVEVGELANETRCFKFWSLKPPASKEKILEEFVDGIHFILSLGLDLSFGKEIEISTEQVEIPLVSQFISIYNRIAEFQKEQTKENYQQLFSEYFNLGRILGFTNEETVFAYVAKNEVNHERQNQGY